MAWHREPVAMLLLALVLLVALPATALCAWLVISGLQQAQNDATQRVREVAAGAERVLASNLADRRALLRKLATAQAPLWLDGGASQVPPSSTAVLDGALAVHPELGHLAVRDGTGQLVHSPRLPDAATYGQATEPAPRPQDVPTWWADAWHGADFSASGAYQAGAGQPWVVALSHAVRDGQGQRQGMVSLYVDLLRLNERVMAHVPSGAIVGVVDRQGRYLLRSQAPEKFLGVQGPAQVRQDTAGQHEGLLTATGPDGIARIYAFVTLESTGWRVIAGLPASEVMAPTQALRSQALWLGTISLTLALLLAWVTSRTIAKPLQALAATAQRMAEGDSGARAAVYGPREVQTLARDFNRMADARGCTEDALRRSEEHLRMTLLSIGDAVITTDLRSWVAHMNPTAERLTGWTLQEAQGQPLLHVFQVVDIDTRTPVADPVARALSIENNADNTSGTSDRHVLLARAGEEYVIANCAAPVRDSAGQAVGVVLVFSDHTQRHRAEQTLLAQQHELRLRDRALAEVSQGVLITDNQWRITYVNPGFTRLTGYSAAQSMGRTPGFLQGQDTATETREALRKALKAGQAFQGEVLNYKQDGSPLWLALDVSPLRDEAGHLTGFVGAQRDITERKHAEVTHRALEAQLRESQKLESIGTLAGGIAHDFNNFIGAILGNAELARQDVGPAHAAVQSLDQIRVAGQRARALVQQILAFSRRQPQAMTVQPLRPVVAETLGLLRATLPAMVELATVLPEEAVFVNADATQLQQVLMNLCMNAWLALPNHGGRIEVGLETLTLGAAEARQRGNLSPGRYAHLHVADNGEGMSDETLRRIFEPFFTTRPAGGGTGLGLSVAHGIVSAHHGSIHAESQVGQGATLHVLLPLRQAPTWETTSLASLSQTPHGMREQVLYVDDDEVMRVMVDRLLHRHGWLPHCVDSASAATTCLETGDGGPWDLLITDYNMPGNSGLDLARTVQRRWPTLPVIISSGLLSDELRAAAEKAGVLALVPKQNLFEELPVAVNRVLRNLRQKAARQDHGDAP